MTDSAAATATTRSEWATLLVREITHTHGRALAASSVDHNADAVTCWMALEDCRAPWNPLATGLRIPGSRQWNSAGVQAYATRSAGLVAVERTLALDQVRGIDTGYAAIVTAITTAHHSRYDAIDALRDALSRSAWSGDPRDGDYYRIPGYSPAWAHGHVAGGDPQS